MIAVDTNILVYAHREDASWHDAAYDKVAGLAASRAQWAIPWPCIHEFFSIVTHRRIFAPPTPTAQAIDQIDAWLESPSLSLLGEAGEYWSRLTSLLIGGRITGPQVHDARIAALCLEHGVRELWSADRDFGRFPNLAVVNPLV